MARANPRVEFLEREVLMLRKHIQRIESPPTECPFHACDNSCAVTRPQGASTNGGCRCDENKLRSALGWWRRYATYLRATLDMAVNGNRVEIWDSTLKRLAESGHAPEGYEAKEAK